MERKTEKRLQETREVGSRGRKRGDRHDTEERIQKIRGGERGMVHATIKVLKQRTGEERSDAN